MIYFVKNNQDILTNKNDACIDPKKSIYAYFLQNSFTYQNMKLSNDS